MKILTIIGARPQFIKAAAVSREIAKHPDVTEVIVHTGQHFDKNMSDIFFAEMQIPKPQYFLNINGLNHGAMTGQMMEKLEPVLLDEKPDRVLVYGDTNTTLAGALTARKLHFSIAHIEAGLRSFNMKMPEEINRILTDRISDVLFCPTDTAVKNLAREGVDHWGCKVVKCGDVMYDAALFYRNLARKPAFDVPENFILATVHRAENTDNEQNLKNIFQAFAEISHTTTIILPLHPRTKKILSGCQWFDTLDIRNIFITEPIGYLEIIYLLERCSIVMTDSGGMQKEAYFFKKPCITLRDETEWVELVEAGVNNVTGTDHACIIQTAISYLACNFNFPAYLYGEGNAAIFIMDYLFK